VKKGRGGVKKRVKRGVGGRWRMRDDVLCKVPSAHAAFFSKRESDCQREESERLGTVGSVGAGTLSNQSSGESHCRLAAGGENSATAPQRTGLIPAYRTKETGGQGRGTDARCRKERKNWRQGGGEDVRVLFCLSETITLGFCPSIGQLACFPIASFFFFFYVIWCWPCFFLGNFFN